MIVTAVGSQEILAAPYSFVATSKYVFGFFYCNFIVLFVFLGFFFIVRFLNLFREITLILCPAISLTFSGVKNSL